MLQLFGVGYQVVHATGKAVCTTAIHRAIAHASHHLVIPAKAGIQCTTVTYAGRCWIPAYAGMTALETELRLYISNDGVHNTMT